MHKQSDITVVDGGHAGKALQGRTGIDMPSHARHLDVGCGSRPRNPFSCDDLYGVDVIEQEPVGFQYMQCNVIVEKLPFEDAFFDSVSCYDFIEHVPRLVIENNSTRFPFIDFMNEIYRVLKPNGILYALTPYYPRPEAFVDPTHVNVITDETHKYFTAPGYGASVYGFTGKFKAIRVKKTKLSLETRKDPKPVKLLRSLYYALHPTKKCHMLWVFKALK